MTYKLLRILILLSTVLTLNSQKMVSQSLEEKFVINRFGTPLMSKPDILSDTLKIIKPGVKILVNSISSQSDSLWYPNNEITLFGNWLKTEFNDAFGYTFSTDLSDNKPIVKRQENNFNQEIYAINILGQKTDSSETTEKVQYSADMVIDVTENYFTFENGKSKESWFDGCQYKTYYLNGWNLNEAFHLMRSKVYTYGMHYQRGFFLDTPILKISNKFYYEFRPKMSAIEKVIISYNEEKNETVINYDSCT